MKRIVAEASVPKRQILKAVHCGFEIMPGDKPTETTMAVYKLYKDDKEIFRILIGAEHSFVKHKFEARVCSPGVLRLEGEILSGPEKLNGRIILGAEV